MGWRADEQRGKRTIHRRAGAGTPVVKVVDSSSYILHAHHVRNTYAADRPTDHGAAVSHPT